MTLASQGCWKYYAVPVKPVPMRSLQAVVGTHLSLQRVHPVLEGLGLGLAVAQAQAAALQLPLERAPLQLQLDRAALGGVQHLLQPPLVALQLHLIGLHLADLLLGVQRGQTQLPGRPTLPTTPPDPQEKVGSSLEVAGPTTPGVTWGQPVTLLRPQSPRVFTGWVDLRIPECLLVWASPTGFVIQDSLFLLRGPISYLCSAQGGVPQGIHRALGKGAGEG